MESPFVSKLLFLMEDHNPSFKTAFKKFCFPNSNPDQSNETNLDYETRKQLQQLKLLEQERVVAWEREKENSAVANISNENMCETCEGYSQDALGNENMCETCEGYSQDSLGNENASTCDRPVLENNIDKDSLVSSCYLYFCFLNKETSEQTVISYFRQFGPIDECCIERNKNGKSKGYGYVIFGDSYSVGVSLKNHRHYIDDQEIKCYPIYGFKKPHRGRRLYIRIPYCVHESDVRGYFDRFAKRKVDIVIRSKSASNLANCYGHATFKDSSLAHKFMNAAPHFIKGVRIHTDFYREKSNESLVSRKLILLNLSPQTTDMSLKEYFGKFGEVESSVVMKFKDQQQSRLNGYIIFQWTAAVNIVKMQQRHIVDDYLVTIIQPKETENESEESRLLIVKRLDLQTREDSVIYYFERYGEVEACLIDRDESGKSKGTCYVVFQYSDIIRKVLADSPHEIDYKNVICLPKKHANNMKRQSCNSSRGFW